VGVRPAPHAHRRAHHQRRARAGHRRRARALDPRALGRPGLPPTGSRPTTSARGAHHRRRRRLRRDRRRPPLQPGQVGRGRARRAAPVRRFPVRSRRRRGVLRAWAERAEAAV
jgi:hypothetical protein